MGKGRVWFVYLLLASQVVTLYGRFGLQPFNKMKKTIQGDDFKAGLPDVLLEGGGLIELKDVDYSAPPKEVFKAVADKLIPVLTTGLALIPGGAIVGGVLSGLWALASPLFGDSKSGPSPMEQIVENFNKELDNIKSKIAELEKKFPAVARKIADKEIRTLIHGIIEAELSRNKYICTKYTMTTTDFVNDMKKNKSLDDFVRLEIISEMSNCDNFLKDTAEAFVFPKYADILWVPSAVTTTVRSAFLTEAINYGVSLKFRQGLIKLFWDELKRDIKRHFEFSAQGGRKRLESLNMPRGSPKSAKILTASEYDGCRIQAQILYLDREIYPYGIPKAYGITSQFNEALKIDDFNVTGNSEARHILVYYNERDAPGDIEASKKGQILMNCFMGPARISQVPIGSLKLRVLFVENRSYIFRVLYYTEDTKHNSRQIFGDYSIFDLTVSNDAGNRTVKVLEESDTDIKITIRDGAPNEDNERFVTKLFFHKMTCRGDDDPITGQPSIFSGECFSEADGSTGYYIVETVAIFDIEPGSELTRSIEIESTHIEPDLIFGVEFIVRPK